MVERENRTRADEPEPGAAVKIPKGRYVVKRHGKDREFPRNTGNSLFLFALRGLFPVAGRVNGPALSFGLFLCRVNFPGLAPTITAGNFLYRHNELFNGLSYANIPGSGRNLAPGTPKNAIFVKN